MASQTRKGDKESVGLPFDKSEDFEEISFDYARNELLKNPEYWHAAHAMFFAREPDRILWGDRCNLSLNATARIMVSSSPLEWHSCYLLSCVHVSVLII